MKKQILGIIYTGLCLVLFVVNANAQYEVGKHYAGPSIGLSFLGSTAQFGLNYEYAFTIQNFGTVGAGGIFRYWSYKERFLGGTRYWITPTIALMGRVGFGTLSYGALEVGVDFKF